ncbi:hypothetical protein RYX36_010692, partial [Vicia faba]
FIFTYRNDFSIGKLIIFSFLEYFIELLSEQEDLIVWMRTAALPTFRKLYGRIELDLKAGVIIYVTLKNQYNTYSFDGKKKLVLSTTSWLGNLEIHRICHGIGSKEAEPNDRKIGKLCDYASKNTLRTPKITDSLEQMCYKDLRNEVFGSVKVVFCVYRKLLPSCKVQMLVY